MGTEVSRCCESGNGEDQNRPWVPFCWETVLNNKSNEKTERCCSLIRDLTRHFRCLKRLHFHEAEIREQNGLGSNRFTTKGPPQWSTSGAPFNWLFVWVLLLVRLFTPLQGTAASLFPKYHVCGPQVNCHSVRISAWLIVPVLPLLSIYKVNANLFVHICHIAPVCVRFENTNLYTSFPSI